MLQDKKSRPKSGFFVGPASKIAPAEIKWVDSTLMETIKALLSSLKRLFDPRISSAGLIVILA